jgi:two-component system, chemotaxis family, protein-glutamate methylesterase/glutaminase
MSAVVPASLRHAPAPKGEIRVMIVDDAVVVRTLMARWIGDEPGLVVVAALRSGREAVDQFEQYDPDVVILDVDMPHLDGISTLPLLLEKKRDLAVIMASALTRDNAEVTLKALSLGAADYIPKPDAEGGMMTSASFQHELIDKVRLLAKRGRKPPRLPAYARRPAVSAARRLGGAIQRVGKWRVPAQAKSTEFELRPFSPVPPRVLLVGASTGGPQALTRLVAQLDAITDMAPVLITQHMPPTFTTILAEHLSRASAKPVREAVDGEPVLAGTIYLAPGDKHMQVARRSGTATIVLDDGLAVNFCKPAVDPLFTSAAEVWGPWNLALILTGMGVDGTEGAVAVAEAGGSVIAQDEPTSVIWGMPGSAVEAGVCSAVLPLEQIGPKVVRLFLGARP